MSIEKRRRKNHLDLTSVEDSGEGEAEIGGKVDEALANCIN